ncbi:MAG: sulfite exporter TauE/SafE family protein [Rhodomicrobium sp.]|nr:sulfite exporter TauE/SafE family protein [Rhodomicrobium sp.]
MITDILAFVSGSLVGFVLGLIGGGGSVLAVPLLVYVVGVSSPHVAIGTSSVAVALSAYANLAQHARAQNVRWPCAVVFAAAGIIGAFMGSTLGKAYPGQKLLLLFGLVMIAVAIMMARNRSAGGNSEVQLTYISARRLLPRLVGYGAAVGALSGFFGIGGGFLVVPGLIAATDMPMLAAVGSSLVSVTAFGLTTAANYAVSGLIDWKLAAIFIAGGFAGGVFGGRAAQRLSADKQTLKLVFAAIVAAVGVYVVIRGLINIFVS